MAASAGSAIDVDVTGAAGQFRIEARFQAGSGVTVLFGRSGAGKSTLLKMISGTLRPASGRIVIGGAVLFDAASGVDLSPARRQIGFVFQDGRLFPHLSVRSNLTYARWAGRRAAPRSLDSVVGLLGLGGLLDRHPGTLSGGERQRVAIGRALLADPRILLMDEPLSSLDHARRQDILPFLEALREETKIPILYVSHEIGEVARLADTLVVVENGNVVANGPAVELFGRLDMGGAVGGDEAGSLIEGSVDAIDQTFGLAEIRFDGGAIEVPSEGLCIGQRVRLRVSARDVALARKRPELISIRNAVACRVEEIRDGDQTHADIVLRAGTQRLRARITRKSLTELGLQPGFMTFALLKAVSIDRRGIASLRRTQPDET